MYNTPTILERTKTTESICIYKMIILQNSLQLQLKSGIVCDKVYLLPSSIYDVFHGSRPAVAGPVRRGPGGDLPQRVHPPPLLQGEDQPPALRQHHAHVTLQLSIATLELVFQHTD